jgi:hypothetical protein
MCAVGLVQSKAVLMQASHERNGITEYLSIHIVMYSQRLNQQSTFYGNLMEVVSNVLYFSVL